MQLKNYQLQSLEIFKDFCKEYSKTGLISDSYSNIKNKYEQRNPIYAEYEGLKAPNVCLRIPTGGGKTLLAVRSLPIITHDLLNTESSLIFWLAPSDPIVEQTINALKDSSHPYRKYLDSEFEGKTVNVISIEEAYTKAFDINTELPIIIATIQTFSTESEEGRRFYRENGVYQEFFDNLFETPSLFNAIKKCNPVVIMDEAHNAKTDLRVSSLVKLNPSFVLELTATPRTTHRPAEGKYASNVLYSVSASQLKAEDMIKLPIRLETVDKWQISIRDALDKRKDLEGFCALEESETGEYIRPIILFRAEANRGGTSISYKVILKELMEEYGIPREEIAVHTSGHEELKGVNLKDRNCPIKYVITIDALKEGWDAPFAYILASVGDINSPTAVEQILGRVLRLPNASPKKYKELERAYAFVASTKTTQVIKNLRDSLVNNGFEELEAEMNISYSPNSNKEFDGVLGGLFEEKETVVEAFNIEAIPEKYKEYINVNQEEKTVSVVKQIPEKEYAEVKKAMIQAVSDKRDIEKIEELLEGTPNILNFKDSLSIPRLLIKQDSETLEFEKSVVLEEIEWTDTEIIQNAKLPNFSIGTKRDFAELDINEKEKIQVKYLNDVKENLFSLNGESLAINEKDLTRLVLNHMDYNEIKTIGSRQLQKFVYATIRYLTQERKLDLIELKTNLFQLTEEIFTKVKDTEKSLVKKQYQSLIEDNSLWEVQPDRIFTFNRNKYPVSAVDERTSYFKKHYYKVVDKLNNEEFEFAKYIDQLEEVEFWVRNLDREPQHAFWLQTSTDKFYPDFIIKLKTGKILVIEFKGAYLDGSDSTEKENLGLLWASLSNDYDFALVYKKDYEEKVKAILN